MLLNQVLPISALPLEVLRKKQSEKWKNIPSDILPLPVAEMDFPIDENIKQALVDLIESSDTGYLDQIPELYSAFAKFSKEIWGWEVDQEHIYVSTDVGVGMVEMARQIVSPGDKILLNSPVYHNFYNWINELKCTKVDAPLKRNGMDYTLDLEAIEAAYKSGVKIHYLCNPQNPTGSVHSKSDLISIANLAQKYGVIVFSDEIHAPLTYDDSTFHPFLTLGPVAQEVGITITSASKTWNLAGLKLAIIVVQSERMDKIAKGMPRAVHYRASLLGAIAQIQAWQANDWRKSALARLDLNRKLLRELIDQELPGVGYRIPDTSYLAWLDFSNYKYEGEIATFFKDKAKVLLSPGVKFDPTATAFVRLNFATSEEIIAQAVTRISSALR